MNPQHQSGGANLSTRPCASARSETAARGAGADQAASGVRQLARLHDAAIACAREGTATGLLETLLELVVDVTDSDFGTVHVLEPWTHQLRLARTWVGLPACLGSASEWPSFDRSSNCTAGRSV
jgi:hypothetical protein